MRAGHRSRICFRNVATFAARATVCHRPESLVCRMRGLGSSGSPVFAGSAALQCRSSHALLDRAHPARSIMKRAGSARSNDMSGTGVPRSQKDATIRSDCDLARERAFASELRHSLGDLLVHLGDILQRLPIFGVSARANASSDRLPEPVGSGPSIVVVFIRRLPSRGVALTHAIGPGAKRCSGSAETIPLRIETTRPTFGQTHLLDRQPDDARPRSDRPAPAQSRDQVGLFPLVTLL